MKNKKTMRAAFAAVLALTLLMHTGAATAQPPDAEESEVEVRFTEGNGGVPPVNPDNPEEPLDPDGGEPEPSGPLALNYISSISFGVQKISSVAATYNAVTMKPFVQVTDLRGTGKGWNLTAKAQPFRNESNEVSLRGSVITLNSGEAVSAYLDVPPPYPYPLAELPTDGETIANVVTADEGEGLGTWVTRWYPSAQSPQNENDGVTLTVLPITATLEQHRAVITWTLSSDVAE